MAKDPEAQITDASVPPEVVQKVVDAGKRALAERQEWETKNRAWYSRRYGIRSAKTFPWAGASNLNIPLTDKIVRRLKPTFQSAIFRVNPIVSIEPLGDMLTHTARTLEYGYDWLVRYKVRRAREEMAFVEDAMLVYGFGVSKVYWDYESAVKIKTIEIDWLEDGQKRREFDLQTVQLQMVRRFGLDPKTQKAEINDAARQFYKESVSTIEIAVEDAVRNSPRWDYVDPIDFIVPWDSTTEIDTFPWCIHRMYLPKHEMEVRLHSKRYTSSLPIEDLVGGGSASPADEIEQRRQLREGIKGAGTRKEEDSEVWECYFRYDLDGDGVAEKFIATVHRTSNETLRVIPYPYEHGEWPFTRFAMEGNEPRWYASRGVPEMVYDLQVEINAQHNAKLDNMAIQNSKSFIYRAGSVRNPGQWRFRPGAMFPARRGPEDVREITHQVMDFSFNAEEENLRAWAEEYIGTPDFGISNINQRVERRTATEVDQIQASTGAVAEEQLERFQESMRRQHRQTLFLWKQFGEDQVQVRVAGKDISATFNRFDIVRDFDLVPTGKLDNMTPQARISKAGQILRLAESQVTGPFIEPFEVTREIVENIDYRNASRFLREPGILENDIAMQQINEVNVMSAIGTVHPVDQREQHEMHVQVLEQAIQANADDEGLATLLLAHRALHLSFPGEQAPLQQLVEAGAQVQQVGTKLVLELPQQQPQGQPQQQEQAPAPAQEGVGVA